MGLRSAAQDRVHQTLRGVGFTQGGEFYVPLSAGEKYVEACEREFLAIVGIEVFMQDNGRLKPDLSQIADFSSLLGDSSDWHTIVRSAAREARRFIEQVPLDDSVQLNFTTVSE